MPKTIDFIMYSRDQIIKLMEGLSVEQINAVPPGFNNNLIWNVAHVVATQQSYLYGKAGLEPTIDPNFVADYKGGTFPKDHVGQAEIYQVKELALSTVDSLARDIQKGVFAHFPTTTITPRAINLTNIDDALEFILFHEGLHLGTAKAIRSAVVA